MRKSVSMFRELWGNALVLLFAFWSGFTSYALLDDAWLRYIEPRIWLAWTEFSMAIVIIPFGLYLFYHDFKYGIEYLTPWQFCREAVADLLIVGFGIWSTHTFWHIVTVGWSQYADWPTGPSVVWFGAAVVIGILAVERMVDDTRRFRRLRRQL